MTKWISELSNDELLEIARKITEVHFPEEWRSDLKYEIMTQYRLGDDCKNVRILFKDTDFGFVSFYDYSATFCNNGLRLLVKNKNIASPENFPPVITYTVGGKKMVHFDVSKQELEEIEVTEKLYKTEMTKKFGEEYQKLHDKHHESFKKVLSDNGIKVKGK